MNRKFFCQKLKQARQQAGIKQEDAAKHLDIAVSGISAIENGSRKIDILELKILSELYKKDLNWFIEESDEKQQCSTLKYALDLLKKTDEKHQKAVAYAIIGFLKNGDLLENAEK